jgi:hypothetical protein
MAIKVVHVSDITGAEADEAKMAKLTIREHPEVQGLPVTLEALPEEVEDLLTTQAAVVVLEYQPPGESRTHKLLVPLAEFQKVVKQEVLTRAVIAEAEQRSQPTRRRGRPPKGEGGRPRSGDGKVNYASLEHAGEPHRGRITDAEKQIVREHFDEVNKRLSAQGLRMIDPADPKMRERYSLD